MAGETASSVYTGWDGDPDDRGPWRVNVLTIDPRTFAGSLMGSFGPDLEQRETTSQLARLGHAAAAVNSGFFVMDPRTGNQAPFAHDGTPARGQVAGTSKPNLTISA